MEKKVGVISDTHGLLRDEVLPLFRDCELIVHAGDIGDLAVLDRLKTLCPVVAVRGNMDHGHKALRLKEVERIEFLGLKIVVIHDLHQLEFGPEEPAVDVVIFGHSHRPKIEYHQKILFFNPGSAGSRRFQLPLSIGKLTWTGQALTPEIIPLE